MRKFTIFTLVFAFFLLTGTINAQVAVSDVTGITPNYLLQLHHNSASGTVFQMTNTTSGSTNADGLVVNLNAGFNVQFDNLEGGDFAFTGAGSDVAIGVASPTGGYKFDVQGGPSTFAQQIELWTTNPTTGLMLADINDNGGGNGIMQLYTGGTAMIRLLALGNSYFTGGFVGIGITGPGAPLHVLEPTFPQVFVENPGQGDASEQFAILNIRNYTLGIFFDNPTNTDHNFKICNTNTLTGPGYTDANTMFEIHDENASPGIIDFNHQSRARVWLQANFNVMSGMWQPIPFDNTTYDEHNEFGGTTQTFTATEEGYYQVNARTDFYVQELEAIIGGHVSIAIFKNGQMYAQGNKLQGIYGMGELLENNLAPNVSDVEDLVTGDRIEIFVFQTVG
ncbi:MAG: hypothetical protein K8R58_07540, partial [Bacteroidales bacterium]|nr:hypothetical protein [Bacteroidales bacterium]